jgi:hypothetical protein
MKRRLAAAVLAILLVALIGGTRGTARQTPPVPRGFFGIAPQTSPSDEDAGFMAAGGIESIRLPILWSSIQPTRTSDYLWAPIDEAVGVAARNGLRILPFLYGTPRWLGRPTKLPIDSARARQAWTAFLTAAVKRYGPGGEFWAAHAPGTVKYEPAIPQAMPIREWQIWNEANFFYFAFPASPQRYARLLALSSPAIKSVDSGAKVVLSGLFGRPTAHGARGMPAAKFLEVLYRSPGIKSRFDGVALHPYAVDVETLEEIVEEVQEVTVEKHDRVPLYVTEMGWGSQNDFQQVAFEQGVRGQVNQLKGAYEYLLENRRRLALRGVYWFSWKDTRRSCNFCDSVGLFRAGKRFHPKPAWRAFVGITGGRSRP